MCKFCKGGKPIRERLKHRVVGAIRFVRVKKSKGGPCLSVSTATKYNGTDQSYIRIYFCPMCGRKLGEEK